MLMLLFVYVFGGAIDTGQAYVNYVVPGIIILRAGFGASTTAVASPTTWRRGSSTGSGRCRSPPRRC